MDSIKKNIKMAVYGVLILLAIFLLVNLLSFFTVIEPGERGILLQFGTIQAIYEPGLHFQIPIINTVVKIDVRTQKSQVQVNAASKDLQSITSTVALNYHIDPQKVDKIYQQIGMLYEERIISPAIQESVKASTAQFTAEELITKRATVKEDIKAKLTERLSSSYLIIDDFSVVDFNFSDEFNRAIELKQTAVQTALKAENDLKRIQIEAQQQIETAKAQAESIKIQGEALKQNQDLVKLKAVEKWNGVLPTYMMGNTVPFLQLN
ncbi:MAG TPA: prohibitin family protein [Candidatus Gracilibacteria bacterium]|nr:prohibitin family protein [Candidatus Gracilibacteria bacterium]HRY90895.1 prohibitin family protein [Candidatus Gracilibacteria bacterium]